MKYKVVKSQDLFDGELIKLNLDELEDEDGNKHRLEIVHHPGGAAIVAVKGNRVLLVKQYRYAIDEFIYELPAGKIDNEEDPALCAMRELEEETGYRTNKAIKLTEIVSTPGFCDEKIYIYFTDEITKGKINHQEGELGMQVEMFTYEEVEELIRKNAIIDAKTIVGIYLAKQYL